MRIGIFSSSLPEPTRKPGGVDVFVDRLADGLSTCGHDVTVLSFTPAQPDARYRRVELSPASYAHRKLARMTVVPLKLNGFRTSGLDVLHLHGDDWFFMSRDVPTVRTFHGSALHEARTATSWKRRGGQLATFGLEVVASRLATRSYMGAPDQGRPYKPIGVLPYAVDVPTTVSMGRTGNPIVLFVGAWAGRKRGQLLYEIFQREVLPRVPTAELHMVSDSCPGGPNVIWWERPSEEQLSALYRRAWAFCLPSSYEGFGLPYAEAMAAGTPVVATSNPGAEHVLDGGRAGLIVPDGLIGQTIVNLLQDEALRLRLATVGRARVQRFSWAVALAAHEEAYAQAISEWRGERTRRRVTTLFSAPRAGRFEKRHRLSGRQGQNDLA